MFKDILVSAILFVTPDYPQNIQAFTACTMSQQEQAKLEIKFQIIDSKVFKVRVKASKCGKIEQISYDQDFMSWTKEQAKRQNWQKTQKKQPNCYKTITGMTCTYN